MGCCCSLLPRDETAAAPAPGGQVEAHKEVDLLLSLKLGLDPLAPPITAEYRFEEVLGRGSFGSVQAVTHVTTGKRYACKRIRTIDVNTIMLKSEVHILKQCRHPNIIALREIFATEEFLYIVMELAKGGPLFDNIMKRGSLTERFAASITAQIASALAFMHDKGVVHRDMKPENLLLVEEGDGEPLVKVCDFGLSKMFPTRKAHDFRDHAMVMKTRVGSQWYASPELLTAAGTYDESIDMWGLGLIVYIMLAGRHPFEGINMYSDITSANLKFSEEVWAGDRISKHARRMVESLIVADPRRRLTAKQVLEHEWLQDGVAKDRSLAVSLAYLRRFQVHHMRELALELLVTRLSDDEIREVREVWEQFDTDRKGYLTAAELREALEGKMKALDADQRYNVPALLEKIVLGARLDTADDTPDGSSSAPIVTDSANGTLLTITFHQFLVKVLEEDDALIHSHLTHLFEAMDVDQNGSLTASDLRAVLRKFALDYEEEHLETMIAQHDVSGTGSLNYAEFLSMMLDQTRRLRIEKLCRKDSKGGSTMEAAARRALAATRATASRASQHRWSTTSHTPRRTSKRSRNTGLSGRESTLDDSECDWNRRLQTVIDAAHEAQQSRRSQQFSSLRVSMVRASPSCGRKSDASPPVPQPSSPISVDIESVEFSGLISDDEDSEVQLGI